MPVIMLVDNGSIRAAATLQLRKIADKLASRVEQTIHAVSFKHADAISADELDNQPANLFREFMTHQLAAGERSFILLPLFFGKSRALTSFVPDEMALLQEQFGDFSLDIADVLYPLPEGESILVDILQQNLEQTAAENKLPLSPVVLVDHGSPVPRVTKVRKHLADALQNRLHKNVTLEQAVMERRSGKKYDFNGKLLEEWLISKAEAGETTAVVTLLFFLPGKHAGAGGDIAEICEGVQQRYPDLRIGISPLISDNDKILDILELRLQSLLQN